MAGGGAVRHNAARRGGDGQRGPGFWQAGIVSDPAPGTEAARQQRRKRHHYLPESYPLIRDQTPATVWLPLDACDDLDPIMVALATFGDQPIIVKDYVKSRKHEWFEACYIPSAVDRQAVARVVTRFLELQSDDVCEGLVFRAYVAFQPIGAHPQSGMPLTREHRLFFLDGTLLADAPYWDAPIDETAELPIDHFRNVAARVPSRFFTMDVAQCIDGSWMIVELGDAQVAGLPERMDVAAFYATLNRRAQHDAGAAP